MANGTPSAKNCNYKLITIFIVIFVILLPFFNSLYGKFFILFFNILYLSTFFVKIYLFIYGFVLYKKNNYYSSVKNLANYPIYSILVPLYKEKSETIKLLLNSLKNLDYPKHKLDIKLILEKGDLGTREVVERLKNSAEFDIIIVPYGLPKTKPRACNYALRYAKGKFVTIYDAEDRPEKYQLKKVIAKFRKYPSEYVCIQAPLNYYNASENFLTKSFCIEYSLWFDFVLRALEKLGLFFPLGGTSNHFKKDKLLEIGGWDAYNVTEDADVGVRMARNGYKIGFVNSITNEEAPVNLTIWIRQRTRWIKGFVQTYFVHMKNPIRLFKELGFGNFLIFQIFIGMSFLFFISLPVVSFLTLKNKDSTINFLANMNLYIMLYSMYISYHFSIYKRKFNNIFMTSVTFPFYWILHCIAGMRTIIQIATSPFYWEKTEHGLSKLIIVNSNNI